MTDDEITLPSGRSFYAHCRIVGIDDKGEISYGYDGIINYGIDEDCLTHSEAVELADIMIARWTEFKRRAEGKSRRTP